MLPWPAFLGRVLCGCQADQRGHRYFEAELAALTVHLLASTCVCFLFIRLLAALVVCKYTCILLEINPSFSGEQEASLAGCCWVTDSR